MMDAFHRLGLPRRFTIDPQQLERAYLTHSRAVHPDYHLAAASADLNASLQLAAEINEAYNILRDPFRRAEHLLRLEGGPTASEQKQLPAAFLAEMLDAREEIEQARGLPEQQQLLEHRFRHRYESLLNDIATTFEKLEPPPSSQRANQLAHIRSLLNAAQYIRGLIRDLHGE
ncbi:MAG: Fe-S protein assembly co-chaperone HscB [Gemmataceae bacterium]|nr:Fe-S protein assembly co-chaperone HscB [Gemmata sp.]MDW8197535.1 Fe-S protein assembly co-chaperone HscB [Gemmataceae bacterium]